MRFSTSSSGRSCGRSSTRRPVAGSGTHSASKAKIWWCGGRSIVLLLKAATTGTTDLRFHWNTTTLGRMSHHNGTSARWQGIPQKEQGSSHKEHKGHKGHKGHKRDLASLPPLLFVFFFVFFVAISFLLFQKIDCGSTEAPSCLRPTCRPAAGVMVVA